MKIEDSVFVYRLSGTDRLSWHGRYHAHSAGEYEIHFFLEGNGSFLCNRTRYPVSGGRLFLTGPREFHSILPEAVSAPLTYYAVLFSLSDETDPADTQLSLELAESLAGRQTVLSIDTNFRFQFEDFLQMARSADPALQTAARYQLSSFLYRWFGRRPGSISLAAGNGTGAGTGVGGTAKTAASVPDRKNRMHVDKALAIMEKGVRENLKVEDMAWKLGLSDEHFIRIFGQEIRMTPHQYYTRLKVEGASGLLMSTDKSIGDISDWFGFENQFHFSRIFKKCTGMSPLEYRRSYIQTVDFT